MNLVFHKIPWMIATFMKCFQYIMKNQIIFFFLACIIVVLTGIYRFEMSVYIPFTTSTIFERKQVFNFEQHYNSSETLKLWSSDFHISPIADIKYLLKDYHVDIIDKSLSGHCHLSNSCQTDLKVINKQNGINLSPCANRVRTDFYRAYRNDAEFQSVDAVLCNHATGMCELFMSFDKPLIVIASTRYEIGRHDIVSWTRWNDNLRRIAADPRNTLAANNAYDREYMKYFTGIDNIALLPNFCDYVETRYKPTRSEILIGPSRGVSPAISSLLTAALAAHHAGMPAYDKVLRLSPIRQLYPDHFEYSQIASHPAVVVLPYQVSFMSLFEWYRMEIPIFVPSPRLLATWHMDHRVLNERTWDSVFGHPEHRSLLDKHVNTSSRMQHDPNDEFSFDAVLEWISLADFYVWPHITQFDSFEDLFALLSTGRENKTTQLRSGINSDFLKDISSRMHQYNVDEEKRIRAQWSGILNKVQSDKRHKMSSSSVQTRPTDVNEALKTGYGYRLKEGSCDLQIDA